MKRAVLFIIIVGNIQLFLTSCRQTGQREEKENMKFYYYPGKNVYYNPGKKSFIYSLNGGKNWDIIRNIVDEEPQTLGEKIIIYSDNNDIFKDNVAHRKMYDGRLYNIITPDTVLLSAAAEVAERKVQKKVTAIKPAEDEEKQVKGLKKLFNKIFRKHKKEEAE